MKDQGLLNLSFSNIVTYCGTLHEAGALSKRLAKRFQGYAQELQAEINSDLLEGIPFGSRRSPSPASQFSMPNASPSTIEITRSKTLDLLIATEADGPVLNVAGRSVDGGGLEFQLAKQHG